MKKKADIFWIIAYGYILLPFLIFAVGWMKWYISLPTVAVSGICFYKACSESPRLWRPEWNRDNVIKMLFAVGIIAVWVSTGEAGSQRRWISLLYWLLASLCSCRESTWA